MGRTKIREVTQLFGYFYEVGNNGHRVISERSAQADINGPAVNKEAHTFPRHMHVTFYMEY